MSARGWRFKPLNSFESLRFNLCSKLLKVLERELVDSLLDLAQLVVYYRYRIIAHRIVGWA